MRRQCCRGLFHRHARSVSSVARGAGTGCEPPVASHHGSGAHRHRIGGHAEQQDQRKAQRFGQRLGAARRGRRVILVFGRRPGSLSVLHRRRNAGKVATALQAVGLRRRRLRPGPVNHQPKRHARPGDREAGLRMLRGDRRAPLRRRNVGGRCGVHGPHRARQAATALRHASPLRDDVFTTAARWPGPGLPAPMRLPWAAAGRRGPPRAAVGRLAS